MTRKHSTEAIAESRAFFGPRAAGWESRFPDDDPLYEEAVAVLSPPIGGVVIDAACGTGRALPALRNAVGTNGLVVGIDVTPEMLEQVAVVGRSSVARLVLGDVNVLPFADGSCDALFAAGLLSHFEDPIAGLIELARVAREGARMAIFHPIGRAALAKRHGNELQPDDIRAPANLERALGQTGWILESIDDGDDRYLAIATRLHP